MAVRAIRRPGVNPRPAPTPRATSLLREGVFVAPGLSRLGESRQLGSLAPYLEALLLRAPAARAPLGGVLGEARNYGQHLRVLRFCINELMPLLRSAGGRSAHCGEDGLPLPRRTFQRLERRASELLLHLDSRLPPLASAEALAARVGVPCVICDGLVIPLSPVAPPTRPGSSVRLGGQRYVIRREEARPYRELLRDLRREQEHRIERNMVDRPELPRMASDFVGDVKSILDRCDSRDYGRYQLFHRDGDHQLQHSHGHWLLTRGPVARRVGRGKVYLGLHLVGRTRREWLAATPRPGATQGAFWGPGAVPLNRGICMGDRKQYLRLISDDFTDAEAVVEWLDAGVILVTGRSELHRSLRASREKRLPNRRVALLQR